MQGVYSLVYDYCNHKFPVTEVIHSRQKDRQLSIWTRNNSLTTGRQHHIFSSLIILEPKRGLTWQNPWYQHMPTTFFKTIVKLVFYSLQRYIIQQITTYATDWNWFTNSRWSTLWRSWKTDLVSVVLILNPLIVTPEINSINCGIIRIISLVCGCWHNFMETFCQIALRRSCLQKTATKNTGPQIWCDMCRLDTIHYLLPANIADVLAPRAV